MDDEEMFKKNLSKYIKNQFNKYISLINFLFDKMYMRFCQDEQITFGIAECKWVISFFFFLNFLTWLKKKKKKKKEGRMQGCLVVVIILSFLWICRSHRTNTKRYCLVWWAIRNKQICLQVGRKYFSQQRRIFWARAQ